VSYLNILFTKQTLRSLIDEFYELGLTILGACLADSVAVIDGLGCRSLRTVAQNHLHLTECQCCQTDTFASHIQPW
jgi:hypothetical protein